MTNIYIQARDNYRDSNFILVVFTMSLLGIVLGGWLFVEDTASSYLAWGALEKETGMNAVIFQGTYLVLSLLFQVMSTIFLHMAIISPESKVWWAAGALGSESIDFLFDLYHRSEQYTLVFAPFSTEGGDAFAAVATVITTLLYTVVSLFLLNLSFGLAIELFSDAEEKLIEIKGKMAANRTANEAVNGTTQNERRQQSNNQQSNTQAQRPAQPIRDPNRAQAQNQRRGQ